jgi:hypothetical protein
LFWTLSSLINKFLVALFFNDAKEFEFLLEALFIAISIAANSMKRMRHSCAIIVQKAHTRGAERARSGTHHTHRFVGISFTYSNKGIRLFELGGSWWPGTL